MNSPTSGEYAPRVSSERQKDHSARSVTTALRLFSRDGVLLFLPVTALGILGFGPWLSFRLPGNDMKKLTLFDLSGGRFLFLLSMLLMLLGVGMSLLNRRAGAVVIALGVGLLGWFSGLAMLLIGLLRGLIPNVSALGVDLADGLLGQGPAVVVALAAAITLSVELVKSFGPQFESDSRSSIFGVSALLILVVLASANHMRWLVIDSQSMGANLAVSGDSLFGSVVIGLLTWLSGSIVVGHLMGVPRIGHRTISVLLVVVAMMKLLQAIFVWAGSGLLMWVIPNSVGAVADVSRGIGVWISAAGSIAALVLGVFGLLGNPRRLNRSMSVGWSYAPGIVVVGIATILLLPPIRGVQSSDSETLPTEGVAVDADGPDLVLSTAYVSRDSADSECVSGSGVFVGDGTYVLTNEHVISTDGLPTECDELWVGFGSDPTSEPDRWFAAEPVWTNVENDLALLKVIDPEKGPQPLQPHYERLPIGEEIRVVGFPGIGGTTLTLTQGVISGLIREPSEFYKVTAAMNPGNSGGPVLDSQGRLVGIATAGRGAEVICGTSNDCYTGGTSLGFVRPIDFARAALEEYTK